MNAYQVGDRVRITASFVNASSVATDPTAVTILVKRRDGPTYTFIYPTNITKTGTGVFYADFDVPTEGNYDYRAVGTGAVITAGEGSFTVPDSQFF